MSTQEQKHKVIHKVSDIKVEEMKALELDKAVCKLMMTELTNIIHTKMTSTIGAGSDWWNDYLRENKLPSDRQYFVDNDNNLCEILNDEDEDNT